MRTFEVIIKVAASCGQILNTLQRFKGIINTGVFIPLSCEQSFMRKPQTPAFVWSIALASIIAWLAVPMNAQKKPARGNVVTTKKVIVMDTTERTEVYDQVNVTGNKSNADEIVAILQPIRGLSIEKEITSPEWMREEQVNAKNADLIIIHLSAFSSSNVSVGSEEKASRKFISFLQHITSSKTKILIYSRSSFLDDEQGQRDFIRRMEQRAPQLGGKIQVFLIAGQPPSSFRNQQARQALQAQVRSILGI